MGGSPLGAAPRWSTPIILKAALCARFGQTEEAHEWFKRRIALDPGLTVEKWKALAGGTFVTPELFACCVDGLRRAGLPEG